MLREKSKLNTIELPKNRGFSYEKMDRNLERKTLLTLFQNRELSLSPKRYPCFLNSKSKLKYIQSHIQLGDIKVRFKIKLHSLSDCKVFWRSNQRSFIICFHCKESYKGLYSHIYKSI